MVKALFRIYILIRVLLLNIYSGKASALPHTQFNICTSSCISLC